jgi:hypothetical protein
VSKKLGVVAIVLLLLVLPASCPGASVLRAGRSDSNANAAAHIAGFLLRLQDSNGAISDEPGSPVVNEDSNMEYALAGLAAAYSHNHNSRYLRGLDRGIRWLAAREEMADQRWRGSWFYAFSAKPPYQPVPTSPGPGVVDVRGVDTTGALFVYLLYLRSELSGSVALPHRYERNARAALSFILQRNRSRGGLFYSSWQRRTSDGSWRLWRFRYAADQGDVYLGLRAGWLLYRDRRYLLAANHLKERAGSALFAPSLGRYAVGIDVDGSQERDLEGFDGVFPQGYLGWIWGNTAANRRALAWLAARVQPSGALHCYSDDPDYSLSAAIFAMASGSLRAPPATSNLIWIVRHTYSRRDGSVRDSLAPGSEKYANVAGFSLIALLGFPALPGDH